MISPRARLFHACAETLALGVGLREIARGQSTEELRKTILGALGAMTKEGRRLGVADGDLAEARYALVAFIDAQIAESEWSERSRWLQNPLQLELFGENTAGENFFRRLRAHLRAADRPAVVEIYYACVALGFVGALAGPESNGIADIRRTAHAQLGVRDPRQPWILSPQAAPTPAAPQQPIARWRPWAPVGVGLLLTLAVLISLASLTGARLRARMTAVERPPAMAGALREPLEAK